MSAVPEQVLGATSASDVDPQETKEWLEALQGVIGAEGPQRAAFLLDKQIEYARINGVTSPLHAETPYINTIPVENQDRIPGNQEIEHRIRS
ncbi:MAG: pyruvate dehydrogenase (acetyl-transferring), homodimeric type, partial [Ralstonia sp.]|nr:pyruvate dehydrogenase (acetyl-transferring), homodimeric type [Ralstonia sp.]